MSIYRISDLNIEIVTGSPSVAESIGRYKVDYDEKPNVTLAMNDDRLLELMEENEGVTADVVESTYIATLYCWALFDFNGFPIRATAVETEDGECVLFAAPYEEGFDPAILLPEDKVFAYHYPGIRMEGDDYYVFDTPFGPLGNRSKVGKKLRLRSIVFVDSKRFDSLRRLESKDFVPMFMRAVALNIRHERTKHTLFVLERVMRRVQFYGVRSVTPYDVDFILERV
jgi:hypothetical protein